MNADDLMENNDVDHSIITGLGCNPSSVIDNDGILDITAPQATSTVGNKKSREDLTRQYLCTLEEASEGLSGEFEQLKRIGSVAAPLSRPLNVCPLKNVDVKVKIPENQTSASLEAESKSRHSSGLMTGIPLIRIDGLSDLSSSRFLVDHTNLSTGELTRAQLEWDHLRDTKQPDDYKLNMEGKSLAVIQTDVEEYGDSDLSQGEVEDFILPGLDKKYLEQSLEVMRCQDLSRPEDHSYEVSTISQMREWHTNTTASEEEGRVGGLPSSLLQPQHSKLKENSFVSGKVHFDVDQISANSTIFRGGLEESKLLSTSCNSLGSIGADMNDVENFSDQSRDDVANEWFEAEQYELASVLEAESFHAPDLDFLEQAEKETCKEFKFLEAGTCDNNLEFSSFSGIYGATEITVRPSWIASPEKNLVGPGNKMLVDDYLKSRSEALGSLGCAEKEKRPNFGTTVHSPPMAGKPIPLIEKSLEEDDASQLHPREDAQKEEAMSSTLKEVEDTDNESQRFSLSSGSDTCTSEVYNISTEKMFSSNTLKEKNLNAPSLAKVDYVKNINKTTNMMSSKDLMGSYLSENKSDASSDHYKPVSKTLEKPCGSREEALATKLLMTEKSRNLGKNLNDIKGSLDADTINSLLSDALASDNPQALIAKIKQMVQEKSVLHKTLDVTDLDISTEVLELRKQREAMHSKPQTKMGQKAEVISVGKENVAKKVTQNLVKNLDKKLMPPPQSAGSHRPGFGISHKHMEKLKANRSNSAPEDATYSLKSNFTYKNENLENTNIDESIKMAPYKSTLFEDTPKLQLTGFHEGNTDGFDASTPCAPSSRPRSKTSGDALQERPVGQTVFENYRSITNPMNQRALPKMGVSSSSLKVPLTFNQNKPPAHYGHGPLMTTVKKGSLITQEPLNNHAPENAQLLESSPINARDFESANVAATLRSTSFPAGLQTLGRAGGTPPLNLASQAVHCKQVSRQYHSHENVSQTVPGEIMNLPQQVIFPNVCVIGIASDVTINFYNPTPRWVQVSLKLMQESIDGCPTAVSALLFKPSYFVEPRNKCEIKLGVCSQFKGLLEAIFEVRVSDLAKGLGTSAAASQVSIQTIIVSANINEPDVQLTCDGEDVLDFGVVPEGCTLTQKVVIINHSPQTLPVVLLLQQVAVTSPIFCWNSEKNEFAKTISPTRLALELPAANNESGPVPQTMNVTLKAPHLDNVKVGENGVVGVRSHMQVELDTPNNSTIIIASFPVKAHIGAVRLESVRTVKSLVLETMANDTCTAPVPLKNSSSFALRVSLESRDHKNLFTVHPNSIVIQPHSQASPNLVFTPQGEEGKMESVLLMRIEPEGMEFEVPIVGISHALPSATVLPQKHVMPGVHETLTKTNSAPLSHVSEKDLASALESTKSRIVFGTVKIGDSSSQKLVVRNNCTTQALSLSLGISGNKAFQVGEFGSKEGQCKMEVVLKPCQELALSIFLCPKEVEPLSATLVCKYRGLTNPFKCKVPLQGYGGKSELEIADACDGKPLFLRDLAPGLPTLVNTTFTNTGDRVMFLKLLVFTDDQCSELLPSSEISVQPSEFVLAPKENRDIFIAATGTANMLAKAPGCVGVLQVISGDEILRQRFRRLKNKEVKIRRINDPSLLKINWDSVYTGKKEVQNEEDCLPPQPEDSAVFFNSCSKIQIQLYGERQAHDDASSTVFACLNADDTVSLEADITAAAGDRLIDTHQPSAHGFTSHQLQKCSNVLQAAATTETGINITWDVFPQCLSILASDVSPHIFFVVNLNNIQQMFEATSDCRWLGIEPREAILPSLSSVKVLVKLEPSRMPQVINPLTHTLKIMCENESRCATITVLPTGGENSAAQSLTVSKQLPSASPPVQQSPVPSTDSLAPKPLIDLQAPELKIPSVRYPSTSANPETTTKTNVANTGRSQTNESEVKHMGSTESLVQLVSDIINFPDTATMKENYVKVKLRNLDGLVHVVRAVVVKGPFALRHTQFSIKSGHYVSVPVYFRPQKAGMYSGQLMLTVLEEQTILPVQLYGRAV